MLNLEDLKILIEFQKVGTLTQTAESLNISQPTLTRVMKRLECEFNVPLFNRTKNKLSLNENGKLAALESIKLLSSVDETLNKVQTYNRHNQMISIGGCAPIPLRELSKITHDFFAESKIETHLDDEAGLIKGLLDEEYQIIILNSKPFEENIYCKKFGEENLMFSLPESHKLSQRDALFLKDLDGENMLLLADIGFWSELPKAKMPHSKFFIQNERDAFEELIHSSTLPHFTTNLANNRDEIPSDRKIIPILDHEAKVSYFICCLLKNKKTFQNLFLNSVLDY